MASEEFTIDIKAPADDATKAAAQLASLAQELTSAGTAAAQAAEAVRAGEAAYKQAENAAARAATAVEKIGVSLEAQKGKASAAAAQYGVFSSQYQKASDKLQKLTERQTEAIAKASAASAAMNAEAVSLDKLRVAASGAADAEAKVAKSLDDATKSAKAQQKAQEAAHKAAQSGAASSQRATENSAKVAAKAAAVFLAVAAAIIAAGAAAAVGIAKITVWAIGLADKNKQIPAQLDRIKKNFTSLFSGLKIDGVIASLEKIGDIFDENSASAKAIKVVFESLFQPLVDGAVNVVPTLIRAFLQFQILVLKALIALKQATNEYSSEFALLGEAFRVALIIGAVFAAILIGVVLVALAVVVAAIIAGTLVIYGIAKAVEWVIVTLKELASKFYEVGTSIIDGMVNGITNGATAVINAVKGVASGAIDAAKKALGIASPSKVFAEIGMNTGEGMSGGVEATTGDVQGAIETMVAPPVATPPALPSGGGAAQSGGAGGGEGKIVQFVFHGVDGAEDALARFEELLNRVTAGDYAQAGLAVPSG